MLFSTFLVFTGLISASFADVCFLKRPVCRNSTGVAIINATAVGHLETPFLASYHTALESCHKMNIALCLGTSALAHSSPAFTAIAMFYIGYQIFATMHTGRAHFVFGGIEGWVLWISSCTIAWSYTTMILFPVYASRPSVTVIVVVAIGMLLAYVLTALNTLACFGFKPCAVRGKLRYGATAQEIAIRGDVDAAAHHNAVGLELVPREGEGVMSSSMTPIPTIDGDEPEETGAFYLVSGKDPILSFIGSSSPVRPTPVYTWYSENGLITTFLGNVGWNKALLNSTPRRGETDVKSVYYTSNAGDLAAAIKLVIQGSWKVKM